MFVSSARRRGVVGDLQELILSFRLALRLSDADAERGYRFVIS
jgi:hypothetical protein